MSIKVCLLKNIVYEIANTNPIPLSELFIILLDFSSFIDIFCMDWEWNYASLSSCFMSYSTGSLMVNTAHRISSLSECTEQGNLPTPSPILLHLLLLSCLHSLPLCTLSFYFVSVLTNPFLSSLSPSLLHPFPFLLGASILALIAPFIKEYKYFFPVCCISGFLVLFSSAIWRPLTFMFCSISCCLLFSCILSAFHWLGISIIPGYPKTCRKGF